MGKAQAQLSEQSMEAKLARTRRRLHEGYQEYADAKRRRTIRVFESPEMARERRKNQLSILELREELRRVAAIAERRALVSSLLGLVGSLLGPGSNENKISHLV